MKWNNERVGIGFLRYASIRIWKKRWLMNILPVQLFFQTMQRQLFFLAFVVQLFLSTARPVIAKVIEKHTVSEWVSDVDAYIASNKYNEIILYYEINR